MQSWLEKLGIEKVNPACFCGEWRGSGSVSEITRPSTGSVIASVRTSLR